MYIAMYLTLGRKVNFGMHFIFSEYIIEKEKKNCTMITLISSQFQMSQVQDL